MTIAHHFDYNDFSKARILTKPMGRVLGQFQHFSFSFYEKTYDMVRRAKNDALAGELMGQNMLRAYRYGMIYFMAPVLAAMATGLDIENLVDNDTKRRIQEMQFAATQIGGLPEIGLSGKATKTGFIGGKLKPGWHGNFADWIKNPEVPENIRKHMIDYAKQFNKPAMLQRLKNLPPINLKSVTKGGISMLKKSGGSPIRFVAGEVVDRGLRMGIDRALQTPQAQQLGRNIMRPLIRGARKIDDALPGVNSKDEALRIARQGTQQLDDVLLNNPLSKNPKLRDIQIDKLIP